MTFSGTTPSPIHSLAGQALSRSTHFIRLLNLGEDALFVRAHLIRAARASIFIQTFIWKDDETGRYLAYELHQAAKRGVEVKVLIDAWPFDAEPRLVAFDAIAHPNLEVKFYNASANYLRPSTWGLARAMLGNFKQVNQRMHNKLFLMDGCVGITGGRNYQNDYYDRGTVRNFKDRDVLVLGPAVSEMSQSFDDYWTSSFSVPAEDLVDVRPYVERSSYPRFETRESFDIEGSFDDLDSELADVELVRRRLTDHIFDVPDVEFVADPPGKNKLSGFGRGSVTSKKLIEFLSQAHESILLQTPYFVLGKRPDSVIRKLRRRNPPLDISVSTNSLASTDNVLAYAFACGKKRRYVHKWRIRIFELKPQPGDIMQIMPRFGARLSEDREEGAPGLVETPTLQACVHAKTFVADHHSVWIGSFNLDPRSFNLNTETALIIRDEAVAGAVEQDIERDMHPRNSWTVGKKQHPPFLGGIRATLSYVLPRGLLNEFRLFRLTDCFDLGHGKEPISFLHEDFYMHYHSVGPFPEVNESTRQIEVNLIKTLLGKMEPLI